MGVQEVRGNRVGRGGACARAAEDKVADTVQPGILSSSLVPKSVKSRGQGG